MYIYIYICYIVLYYIILLSASPTAPGGPAELAARTSIGHPWAISQLDEGMRVACKNRDEIQKRRN